MRDIGAAHHAAEDRAQPRLGKHLLCEDDEGVMHIVLRYGSGDAVQVSPSQCAIGPQPEDKNGMSYSIVFDHDLKAPSSRLLFMWRLFSHVYLMAAQVC